MAVRDHHSKPFDEGTILKLELFEAYLTAWLPTFVMSGRGDIQVWDLFAGPGYDENGVEGSPLRILRIIEKFRERLEQKRKKVTLYLNEYESNKCELLRNAIARIIGERSLESLVTTRITSKDFSEVFRDSHEDFRKGNNLIFLDQNGVKQVTEQRFQRLLSYPRTDFIFFISSSYFKRFASRPEFKKSHPTIKYLLKRNSVFISVVSQYS